MTSSIQNLTLSQCLLSMLISISFIVAINIENTAKHLKFKAMFDNITSQQNLQERFDALLRQGHLKVKDRDVHEVSAEYNANLRQYLLAQISSVERIKKRAQELHKKYQYDENIKPFNYHNNKGKHFVREEPTFVSGIEIDINKSFVQLPTNIYIHSKTVLNTGKWTEGLDEIFLQNHKETPSLLWQYFGSQTGAIRTFPGSLVDPTQLDLYDCRRRLWYSQAINSPKDVLIVVDRSGSMTGNHWVIAKIAVKSLIDTLQQDDFLNVVMYKKSISFLLPCLANLTQATSRNKKLFKNAMDGLEKPGGESDPKTSIKQAFEVLQSDNYQASSGCTKVLLLISDGIEDDDTLQKEIFQLNEKSEIIIFSYIVGVGSNTKEMKQLACNNGGHLYHLPTVGSVWNRVLEYQIVLSNAIAKSNDDVIIFTPLYLDSSGLGMLMTMSTSVFADTNTTVDHHKLLGVAGIDISLDLIKNQYSKVKLGVFGHAFAVNNNGLFLSHPRFRDQSGYLPDPATVYLNEVEYTTDPMKSLKLLKHIVDGREGCMEAEVDWLYFKPNFRRVIRYNTTYCYAPMARTPFFTGISMPKLNQKYMDAQQTPDMFLNDSLISLSNENYDETVRIANWIICDIPAKEQQYHPASMKKFPTAEELKDYLSSYYENPKYNAIPENCNAQSLSNLLLFSKTVYQFKDIYWRKQEIPWNAVTKLYVITSSGYILSYWPETNKSDVISRDIFTEQRFVHPSAFYMKNMEDIIVFTTKTNLGEPSEHNVKHKISIGKALTVSSVLTAVIGMDVYPSYLRKYLLDASKTDYKENFISYTCEDVDNLSCYLLDENGYVVIGNKYDNEQGVYFGNINGVLMSRFEELNIYIRDDYLDKQSQCAEEIFSADSGAGRLESLQNVIFTFFIAIFHQFFTLTSMITTTIFSASGKETAPIVRNVSCTKSVSIHTVSNYTLKFSENTTTRNCRLSYGIQSIVSTNLVLVVFTNDCQDYSTKQFQFKNEPTKIEEPNLCEQSLRYRNTLPVCYKSLVDDHKCSSANVFQVLWILLITSLCLVLSSNLATISNTL